MQNIESSPKVDLNSSTHSVHRSFNNEELNFDKEEPFLNEISVQNESFHDMVASDFDDRPTTPIESDKENTINLENDHNLSAFDTIVEQTSVQTTSQVDKIEFKDLKVRKPMKISNSQQSQVDIKPTKGTKRKVKSKPVIDFSADISDAELGILGFLKKNNGD